MSLENVSKQQIISDFKINPKDTGSTVVQIALLTGRIQSLTEHLKIHKKDFHSRMGLLKQVNQRRSLLSYLKRTNPEGYQQILARLGLRR